MAEKDDMRCVEICTKGGKMKRLCPRADGKGLDEKDLGDC
jgi:hypothetical protein